MVIHRIRQNLKQKAKEKQKTIEIKKNYFKTFYKTLMLQSCKNLNTRTSKYKPIKKFDIKKL